MSEQEIQQELRVVRGNPNAEELAALIAVVQAAVTEQTEEGKKKIKPKHSTWNRSQIKLRTGITPGNGQWNAVFRDGLN